MSKKEIFEIEGLFLAEDLAEEYEDRYGMEPFNISHWDPSDHLIRSLLKYLRLPLPSIVIPYIYSYAEGQELTLRRLGFASNNRKCWLVNSGTIAVLLGAWWVKAQNIHQLLILGPTYFPVFHVRSVINLPTRCLYMQRQQGRWKLPREQILAAISEDPSRVALWVTNPVFSTGCYLSPEDTDFLSSILTKGVTIVADECLAINGFEIGGALGGFEQFLGLYSPHKSLCINSTKFAAVVFDECYDDFFHCWTDVLAGPLASSSYSAVNHFLGENFSDFQTAFFSHLNSAREKVLPLIHNHNGVIETDDTSEGNFITCYAPGISALNGNDGAFLKDLIWNTGTTLIPGTRSYLDPALGFSFRINLARASPQFYSALQRVTKYLSQPEIFNASQV